MFVIRTVQVALDKVHKGIQLTIILGVLNLPACWGDMFIVHANR